MVIKTRNYNEAFYNPCQDISPSSTMTRHERYLSGYIDTTQISLMLGISLHISYIYEILKNIVEVKYMFSKFGKILLNSHIWNTKLEKYSMLQVTYAK